MSGKAQAVEPRSPKNHSNNNLPRYDQQLLAAKNSGAEVHFQLALETDYSDGDGHLAAKILEVCRYSIKIETVDYFKNGISGKSLWINKAFIVSTEVLS